MILWNFLLPRTPPCFICVASSPWWTVAPNLLSFANAAPADAYFLTTSSANITGDPRVHARAPTGRPRAGSSVSPRLKYVHSQPRLQHVSRPLNEHCRQACLLKIRSESCAVGTTMLTGRALSPIPGQLQAFALELTSRVQGAGHNVARATECIGKI